MSVIIKKFINLEAHSYLNHNLVFTWNVFLILAPMCAQNVVPKDKSHGEKSAYVIKPLISQIRYRSQ